MDKTIDTPSREIDLGNIPVHLRTALRRALEFEARAPAPRSAERSSAKSSCGPSRTSSSAPSSPPCCNARWAPPRLATRRAPSCATCPGGCATAWDRAGHDGASRRRTTASRPSGEAEADSTPPWRMLGIYDRCTPKLASDASRGRHAQLAGRSAGAAPCEGIALDIKTLRSTAYRYAARARAAQQSAACGLLDRVTGKRVVVSLDGGRVRVRRKKRGPKTKKGHTDSIPRTEALILLSTGDRLRRGRRRHAPGTGGGLRLSYARQIGSTPWALHRRRRALDLATSSVRSPRSGSRPVGLIGAKQGRGSCAAGARPNDPLAPHAGAAQASTGGRGDHGPALPRAPPARSARTSTTPAVIFRLHHPVGLRSGAVNGHPSRHQSPLKSVAAGELGVFL